MMESIKKKWSQLPSLAKTAYALTGFLLLLIPFEGLVLESFNLAIPGIYAIVSCLYWAGIVLAAVSKQWKLLLIAVIAPWLMWALTIGLSEVLWHYLKTWFGIDISYR